MQLLSVYIQNFGNIEKQKFNFKENDITSFMWKNGQGKTTLCAFIKAMLYGMESVSIKSKNFLDREHYFPFSNAQIKGNMLIKDEGKTYRLERSFDKKSASKDTLYLYDDNNELITSLNGQKIDATFIPGLYFLHLDKEAFQRTIFINSIDLSFQINDSIKTKLNGVFLDLNRYNDYEEVIKKISDDLKENKKNTQKYLNQPSISDQINQKKAEIEMLKKENQSIGNSLLELNDLYQKYQIKNQEKKKLEKKQIIFTKQQETKVKWDVVHKYEHELSELENSLHSINCKYPQGFISEEDLHKLNTYYGQYNSYLLNQNNYTLTLEEQYEYTELQKSYKLGMVNEEDYNTLNDNMLQINTYTQFINNYEMQSDQKYLTLKKLFTEVTIINDTELIDLIQKYNELNCDNAMSQSTHFSSGYPLEKELREIKNDIDYLQSIKKTNQQFKLKKGIWRILIIIFTFGIYLKKEKQYYKNLQEINIYESKISTFFTKYNYLEQDYNYRYILLDNDLKAYLNANIENKVQEFKVLKTKLNTYFSYFNLNMDINEAYKAYKALYNKFNNLSTAYLVKEKEIKKNQEKIDNLKNINSEILQKYQISTLKLNTLKDDYKKYQKFSFKENMLNKIKQETHNIKTKINDILTSYGLIINEDITSQINHIKQDKQNIDNYSKNLIQTKEEMLSYKQENALIKEEVKEELSLSNINEQIALLNQEINGYNTRILDLESLHDKIEDNLAVITSLNTDIASLEENKRIKELTYELIVSAENELEKKYLKPIKDRFDQYINLIKAKLAKDTIMKFDYNVYYDINGELKKSQHLSQGESTIMLLALRFAIIDQLYLNNDVFLILDDPFEALDEDNLAKIKEVLLSIGKNKQVIYFTCHASRSLG